MTPHFFGKGRRINAATYAKILEEFVKPWIDSVHGDRPYVFQQDPAPTYKAIYNSRLDSCQFPRPYHPKFMVT